jgi:hypothetical protein
MAQLQQQRVQPIQLRPLQSPAPLSDRYAMPSTLPPSASVNPATQVSPITTSAPMASASLASTASVLPVAPGMPVAASTPVATPFANATPAVRTTAAVGGYRPGGTSSYTPGGVAAPIEVATRPAPASSAIPASAPLATPGFGSEPWTPPVPSVAPTRTY